MSEITLYYPSWPQNLDQGLSKNPGLLKLVIGSKDSENASSSGANAIEEYVELPKLPETLVELYIWNIKSLRSLGEALPESLAVLDLYGCVALETLPKQKFAKLEVLDVSGCKQLTRVYTDLKKLIFFHFDNTSIRSTDIQTLIGNSASTLREITGIQCSSVDNLNDALQDLATTKVLERLDLSGSSIQSLPDLSGLIRLTYLNLENCKQLKQVSYFPDSLNFLVLSGCDQLKWSDAIGSIKESDTQGYENSGIGKNVVEEFLATQVFRGDARGRGGTIPNLVTKVMLLGNGGVGKTSLAMLLDGETVPAALYHF
jgi:hypothetical protein